MRTLNKTIEAAQCANKIWESELFTILHNYRATPHSSWFKKLPYSQPMEEEEDDCDYAFEKDRTLTTKRCPVRN